MFLYHVSKKETTVERVFLISSSSNTQVSREQTLALDWDDWGIANRLHHVRDMTYDEDRCRAGKGDTPRALTCLRNFADGTVPPGNRLVCV